MESDGADAGRVSGKRLSDSGFYWAASSPSPMEVARLETLFPDVVRVPDEELREEMDCWYQRAVIVRSFSKWVPAEAFIREFRRAGVSGEIVPVSMAFRCHVFRFATSEARDLVLQRPWVINGQVVGTELWQAEFTPAEDSVSSALMWVRLPNLPMEFWKEEFLKSIVSSAGEFLCADAATSAKSRGGFARVCLRVDLRRPLRPGVRIQGIQQPFWQQFAYEQLQGICMGCGSLHLGGPCSSSANPESSDSAPSVPFGPWLSAIRHRRTVFGSQRAEKEKVQTNVSSGISGLNSASSSVKEGLHSRAGGSSGG